MSTDDAHFGIDKYQLSDHALFQLQRRGLSRDIVDRVVRKPEQVETVREGRVVMQSRYSHSGKQTYLVRVLVDIDRAPPVVVTAYRTSKLDKYWREKS